MIKEILSKIFKNKRLRGFEDIFGEFSKNKGMIPILPQRADVGSCAYDIPSPIDFELKPNEQKLIWTDVKVYMQLNEVFILNVRSNQGKIRIQLANTQGWVDSTYYNNPDNEGNIGIFLRNEGTEDYKVVRGDRICQGMFTNYLITDNDNPVSKVRLGGFGSSGK